MIELLSPAGNFEKLKAAVLYGADAVYFAGQVFGMRAAADNFSLDEIKEAVKYCHARGVKAYLTVNVMPREDEYPALKNFFISLKDVEIDALIIGDIGVLSLANEILPDVDIHISTQASTVSSQTCKMWQKLGATRVVLARELSLEEISSIRANIPKDLELEVFIHGSMCISYSGRCLLSEYYTGRGANCGKCTQPCRWEYKVISIAEEKRPGDVLDVIQTSEGCFVMSSKDLCMIEHIPDLLESGVTSFKIEGRMKSAYYTAVTTNAYKIAFNEYLKNKEKYIYNPLLKRELESVSHREYDTGFFYDKPCDKAQITQNNGYLREKAYIAVVEDYDKLTGIATLVQRNKFSLGDILEVITPGKVGKSFTVNNLMDENGCSIDCAPHPKMICKVTMPFEVKPGDIVRM